MIVLFLLPVLIFADNNIFDVVNNKLNKDANPCDDFFEHVCSNQKKEDTFTEFRTATVNGRLAPYETDLPKMIQAKYDKTFMVSEYYFEMNEDAVATELTKRCKDDSAAFDQYLKMFDTLEFPFEQNDCVGNAKLLSRFMYSLGEPTPTERHVKWARSVINVVEAPAHIGQITAYRKYTANDSDFEDSQRRVHDMFVSFKRYMRKSIQASPRNRNNYYVEFFLEQVNNMELYDWNTPDVFSKFSKQPMQNLGAQLDRCFEAIVGHFVEVTMCMYHAVSTEMGELLKEPHLTLLGSGISTNALYNPAISTVFIFPAFYADETDSINAFLQYSSIYVHEMGHGIYLNESYINHCLPERMNASNALFCKGDCRSGTETIREDAADWNAVRIHLDVVDHLSKVYPEYIQEARDKFNDKNLSLHQIIFYAIANTHCTDVEDRGKIDTHSVRRLRVDGMFRMFPEFQRAFKCKNGDKMRAKQNESCALSGPRATRKSSSIP